MPLPVCYKRDMQKALSPHQIFKNYCALEHFPGGGLRLQNIGELKFYRIIHEKQDALREALHEPVFDPFGSATWKSWSGYWAGACFMLKYIDTYPEKFAGKKVYDLGAGSGLVAMAAARVGADVVAVDSEPLAVEAIKRNAHANNVSLQAVEGNLFDEKIIGKADILIAADIQFYIYKKRASELLLAQSAGKELYMVSSDTGYHFQDLDLPRITDPLFKIIHPTAQLVYYDGRPPELAAKPGRAKVRKTTVARPSPQQS